MKKLGGFRTIPQVAVAFGSGRISLMDAVSLFSLVEWWSTGELKKHENAIKWLWSSYARAVLREIPPALYESDVKETKAVTGLGSAMGYIIQYVDGEQWYITAHEHRWRDGVVLVGAYGDHLVERSERSEWTDSFSIPEVAKSLVEIVTETKKQWEDDEYAH